MIRSAQQLGFTLREIAALADSYERKGLTAARKVAILKTHLAALDARASELRRVRRYLAAKLAWLESGQIGAPPRLTPSRSPR